MSKELETKIAIGGQLDPSLARVVGAVNKNLSTLTKQAALADKAVSKGGTSVSSVMSKIGAGATKMGELTKAGFGMVVQGAKMAVAGIAIVATVASSAVVGAYKLADSASNLSESANVVQQTYKTTSDSILGWTKTVAAASGISQANATAWAGSMGAMLTSSGLGEKASGVMSKSLVQLTGDMSSFYNLSNDEAWEKIRSGITGETEPLKQLGINMSNANLQAFALAQGIKTPWAKMSQAQQTMLRYNYLMNVTKNAQGDFGRTLETSFPNQVRVAKLNLQTLGNTIGQKFLPDFMNMVKAVNGGFKTGDWSTASQTVGQGLAGILGKVSEMAPQVIGIVANILPGLVGGVVTALPSFTQALVTGLLSAVGALAQQAPALIPALLSTVQIMITGLTIGIVQYGPTLFSAGIQLLTGFVGMLVTAIPTALPVLVTGVSQVIGAVVGLLPTVLPVLVNGVLFLLNSAIAVLANNGPAFLTAALNAVSQLALGVLKAAPKLIPVIVSLVQSIVTWFGTNLPVLVGAGIDAVIQISMGLIEALPQLIAMLPMIINAIVTNLSTNMPKLMSSGVTVLTTLITAIIQNLPMLIKAGVEIATGLLNAMISNISMVLQFPQQLFDALGPAFASMNWGQIGMSLLVALVNGMAGAGNLVVNTLNTLLVDPINRLLAPLSKLGVNLQIPHIPNIPTIPAYASGIMNAPGGVSLVGELGPELVNLPRGSTVYNHSETRQMLSGGGGGGPVLQFFINITGGTGTEREDVRRGVQEAIPSFEDAIEAWQANKRRVSFGY